MFHAYTNALDLIRALVPVVEQLKRYDSNLADQVIRAATSVTLNVAEGARRGGKDRRRFYVMARGSAGEIQGALDTADAWGWRVESERAVGEAAARSPWWFMQGPQARRIAVLRGECGRRER